MVDAYNARSLSPRLPTSPTRVYSLLTIAAYIVILMLLLWAAGHLAYALAFRRLVRRSLSSSEHSNGQNERGYAPKVSVILALRGYDPSLLNHLNGLLEQDYGEYEIVVVVDSEQDSAWAVVEEFKQNHAHQNRIRSYVLQSPPQNCSLKCASVVQGYSKINPSSEVIALIDADVTPHPQWLSQLVEPLEDQSIGVCTGNQWYSPLDDSIGSMLRCLWNAGTLPPSALYGNPWAGSCALRVTDVERSGLVETWSEAAVDDGPIRQALRPLGLKVHFEPRLIMVNRDPCTYGYVNRYGSRMLTWSRLYEPEFTYTIFHALITVTLLLASLTVFGLALFNGSWSATAIMLVGLVAWNAAMFGGFCLVRDASRLAVASRCDELESMTVLRVTKMFALMPVCLLSHVVWTFVAAFSRKVDWREVTYRLKSKNRIELIEYQPYPADSEHAPSRVSI